MKRNQFYWAFQLGGWMLFVLLQGIFLSLKKELNNDAMVLLMAVFISGILLTQLLRAVIIRFRWLNISRLRSVPMMLVMIIAMGGIVALMKTGLEKLSSENNYHFDPVRVSLDTLNFSLFFFFWSVIYFLVHIVENYKRAEIENLKWEAAIKETELNKLKSQLNPHFMFNAMNSIRALVGENPARAKEAVTQFSNLLRNTLQVGKQKFIPLSQEMEVVKDYIAIESVRLEERLKVELNIPDECLSFEIPPLMIQTLVENGIKHGIAKIPEGGKLFVNAKKETGKLHILIFNSGKYNENSIPESGFGLRNTKERLAILYNGKASFTIANTENALVKTELIIPEISEK
ncbi:MAG: histidine kinase [Bacteroidetes bacterium]|nr:histidine kinase [Bacteroidota bacterium]